MEGNSHTDLSFNLPETPAGALKSVESGAVDTDLMLKCSNAQMLQFSL